MPGGFLYGWDSTNSKWVKLVCDANGKLKIDPALILENPPTEDEAKKGATSEWCFDHDADVSAHHVKYTNAEARAAINDIFGSDGKADSDIDLDFHIIKKMQTLEISQLSSVNGKASFLYYHTTGKLDIWGKNAFGSYNDLVMRLYKSDHYEIVQTLEDVNALISTHKNIAAAHHAKYTDAQAQAACNLDGDLYWSCAGVHFDAVFPDTNAVIKGTGGVIVVSVDNITFVANVNLPSGATITGVKVMGNAAAADETWYLERLKPTTGVHTNIATANINTQDTSITNPVVDNENYNYYFYTTSLDTNDMIYGASIKYTL